MILVIEKKWKSKMKIIKYFLYYVQKNSLVEKKKCLRQTSFKHEEKQTIVW